MAYTLPNDIMCECNTTSAWRTLFLTISDVSVRLVVHLKDTLVNCKAVLPELVYSRGSTNAGITHWTSQNLNEPLPGNHTLKGGGHMPAWSSTGVALIACGAVLTSAAFTRLTARPALPASESAITTTCGLGEKVMLEHSQEHCSSPDALTSVRHHYGYKSSKLATWVALNR